MTTAPPKEINGRPRPDQRDAVTEAPMYNPVAEAEAEAIRARTYAENEALRTKAVAEADAITIKAAAEAEKQRLANERSAMLLEEKRAAHEAKLAAEQAKKAEADAAKKRANDAVAAETAAKQATEAEQQRSENTWKWAARGIYGVGLIIAAPVQFIDFWDKQRPFLVAAPALLEGFALVLAAGAAWAVAHRRDVLPYRIGIMFAALIAAGINMRGGMTNPALGFNAGLIGAIASLGGPIVLMAYEHGIAQKADGVQSMRDRRAAEKERRAKAVEEARQRKAREGEKAREAHEKAVAEAEAREEQERKDRDRQKAHPEVWEVAEAIRSARGSEFVTEAVWSEAWWRVTGSKVVGIDPEIEARSKAAQQHMKTVSETPVIGEFSLINSQRPPKAKRDPNAPDGRRNNGGTPPRRVPGDSAPVSPIARKQAAIERTQKEDSK